MNKVLVFCLFASFSVISLCSAESISDHVIKFIDEVDQEKSISLPGGFQLNKIEKATTQRAFPDESIVERMIRFVDTHEFSAGNENDSGNVIVYLI